MLKNVKNGERLPFSIRFGDSNITPYYYSSEEDEEEEESEGVSNAVVAGISIGTFVIGVLVGIVAIVLVQVLWFLVCSRKKGGVNVSGSVQQDSAKYERQFDDITSDD